MKAEQRKELETNALADRMGRAVKRMKAQPRRATLYYVIGAVALFIVLFVIFRTYQVNRQENSQFWHYLYNGTRPALGGIIEQRPDGNQGKAALFEFAWFKYWDAGLRRIGVGNGTEALMAMDEAAQLYEKLAKDCEGDPVWEPEAMYGLAAIEETRAVQNLDHLEAAKKRYEELASKYPKSARGQLAKEWVENYDDAKKRQELTSLYQELRTELGVPDLVAPKKGGFGIFDKSTKKDTKAPGK
jgi:hypothetical protein